MLEYKADNLGCTPKWTRGECFGKELNAPQNCNSFQSGTMIQRMLKVFSHIAPAFGTKEINVIFILPGFSDSVVFIPWYLAQLCNQPHILPFFLYLKYWMNVLMTDSFFQLKFMSGASISIPALVFASHWSPPPQDKILERFLLQFLVKWTGLWVCKIILAFRSSLLYWNIKIADTMSSHVL